MPMRQPAVVAITWILLLFPSMGSSPLHAGLPQDGADTSPQRTFLGVDGSPLPFENDAELIEFLQTAEVIDATTIETGVNRSQKVTLEQDGVRAHAAFRQTDKTERGIQVGGISYRVFRDSFLFEPAAYQLALTIGVTNIPPAVRRRVGRQDGSLQIWIENVLDEEGEGFRPPDIGAWVHQIRDMILFDNFIYNPDRNGGNILVTADYQLMMIDHTRAFQEKLDILDPERLIQVNRGTWQKFLALTPEEIRDAVRPYLSPREMSDLVRRREAIVEHIQTLIRQRGERVVVRP